MPAFLTFVLSMLNHRQQDILVHQGLHRKIIQEHLGHAYLQDDAPYTLQESEAHQLNA